VAKRGGKPAYEARSLVLCALLKVKMDYRSISLYLKANPELLKIVGLDRAPSRETIRAALLKLPESYLKRVFGNNPTSKREEEPNKRTPPKNHQPQRRNKQPNNNKEDGETAFPPQPLQCRD
jgi:hypothetical protein